MGNNMLNDLISRQAAIDAAVEAADEWDGGYSRSREEIITLKLRMLPSAQPEIIRCKDCKYGEQDEIGRWYCRGLGCQMGDDDGNGFCSDAEKREEWMI